MKGGEVVEGAVALIGMLRVGLTGGLASGKSTVAGDAARSRRRRLRRRRRSCASSTRRAARGRWRRRELFGDDVLGQDGRIDRARIAEIVFADPARATRSRRASIPSSGPSARAASPKRRTSGAARRRGRGVAAPRGADRIGLRPHPARRRPRGRTAAALGRRKAATPEDARRRIAAQIPAEAARAARHRDVIVNDGTLEDLRRQVEAVYRGWTS